jgi:DNA-binding beta-propeller fold protein YncE
MVQWRVMARRLTVATGLFLTLSSPLAGHEPLTLIRAIPLPNVEGRIDHLSYDAAHQRLLVAALGNNSVEIIDIAKGAHLKSLPGFREPQGISVTESPGLIAVANGQGEGLQLLRSDNFQNTTVVRLGDDADNVRYDRPAKRLYVGYGDGALAAVDADAAKLLGEVNLPGHPESFQLETTGPRLFVNVPSAQRVVVIDRTAMKIVASWPVVAAKANYPMALDEPGHRLLIGCRSPSKVLVLDTTTGAALGSIDIVGDTDDMFYDGARKRLYVSGGAGSIDVFQDSGGARFTRIAQIPTAAGARTSLYVPERNELYLAVPHRGAQRAEIRVYAVDK